jgi:hypothetical protein
MLVPGEYMLKPQEAIPQPQPDRGMQQTSPAAEPKAGEIDDAEPPTFLLTLLRILGVIHT